MNVLIILKCEDKKCKWYKNELEGCSTKEHYGCVKRKKLCDDRVDHSKKALLLEDSYPICDRPAKYENDFGKYYCGIHAREYKRYKNDLKELNYDNALCNKNKK